MSWPTCLSRSSGVALSSSAGLASSVPPWGLCSMGVLGPGRFSVATLTLRRLTVVVATVALALVAGQPLGAQALGGSVSIPLSDVLATGACQSPPLFTASFVPSSVSPGQTSTLRFTVDNTAATVDATGLEFANALPAGLVVAPEPNATSTCGGSLTATAGSGTVSFTGGSVAAGATCVVTVEVRAQTLGTYDNVSDVLTSSLGESGTAAATLRVTNAITSVPTLGTWGLLALSILCVVVAWRRLG